jgi:hypothetical protein
MMVRCKIHKDKAHLLVPVLQLSAKKTGDPQVRFEAGRARERQLVWGTEGPGVHSVHQEVSTGTGAAGIERTQSCRVPLFF